MEWQFIAEVMTDLDPALPMVPCYPGEFNQAILHLVVNSASAISRQSAGGGDAKGLIKLTSRQADRTVEVSINDTGAGIREEIRDGVFEPWFEVPSFGIPTAHGLSFVHRAIVGRHGGTINVQSQAGKGTTFLLRLPLD